VIRGDASNKPHGILHTAPSARDDFDSPIRAAGSYEYIDDQDSPHALGADVLIDMVYTLNSAYRQGASWAMNSKTTVR
jgi:HK97 family phage major capsid protein